MSGGRWVRREISSSTVRGRQFGGKVIPNPRPKNLGGLSGGSCWSKATTPLEVSMHGVFEENHTCSNPRDAPTNSVLLIMI